MIWRRTPRTTINVFKMKIRSCHLLLSFFVTLLFLEIKAQQNVGIGTATPNASAQLDISSTTKGTLITRMTTAQRKAIASPAIGLLVYDLDKKTIYMYEGTKWQPLLYTTTESKLPPVPVEATGALGDDWFGYSVSISGNYAIVGAIDYDEGASNQGAAYIFVRTNGSWVQQARLISSNWEANGSFGYSVGISGDYAVVGTPYENVGPGDQGRAYIFHRSGTVWSMQGFFTNGDGAVGDRFGHSVSISGDYVIVGAPYFGAADRGSAYIYYRGGGWIPGQGYIAKLPASDGGDGDLFGSSVCIDGDYAIVGANSDDGTGGADQGSAYVYFKGTDWLQLNHFHQAKLTATDGLSADRFGISVSINGPYAIVGAYLDGILPTDNQGSAYIYFRTGASWSFQTKLTADDDETGDLFGKSVSINGDYAIVGAYEDDAGSNMNQGSAYVYKRSGTSWTLVRKIDDDSGQYDGYFGSSVAVSGFNLLIGAYLKNNRRGQAFFLNVE